MTDEAEAALMPEKPYVVYLDQFVWVDLAKGRKAQNPLAETAITLLTRLRQRGAICVPVSATNYLELWHRRRVESLTDIARLIRSVGGYETIAPFETARRGETDAAIAQRAYAPAPLRHATIGRGANHAFDSPTGRLRFVSRIATDSTEEGNQLSIEETFPDPRTREAFLRLASSGSEAWEWFNLAGDRQFFEFDSGRGLDRAPEHRVGTAAMDEAKALRQALTDDPRMLNKLDELATAREFNSLIPSLRSACRRYHFDLTPWLANHGHGSAIHALIHDVPTSHVRATIERHRHRDRSFPLQQHDDTDLCMLATVVPACDVVVTEKRWAHIVRQSGLAHQYGTTMLSSIREVVHHLTGRFGHERETP